MLNAHTNGKNRAIVQIKQIMPKTTKMIKGHIGLAAVRKNAFLTNCLNVISYLAING
jgi:hypothetical protein